MSNDVNLTIGALYLAKPILNDEILVTCVTEKPNNCHTFEIVNMLVLTAA